MNFNFVLILPFFFFLMSARLQVNFGASFLRPAVDFIQHSVCCIPTKTLNLYFKASAYSWTTMNLLRDLNSCGNTSVLLATYENERRLKRNLIKTPSIHVLLIPDTTVEEIDWCLGVLHRHIEGKEYLKFFIIFEANTNPESEWLQNMMMFLWKEKQILNVVAIFQEDLLMRVYTYNPFSEEFLIDLSETDCKHWFYGKLLDMNGALLRISMFEDKIRAVPYLKSNNKLQYRGADGYFAEFLEQKLNATFVYSSPADGQTYGERRDDGTVSGGLGEVANWRADFAFNLRFLSQDYYEGYVEITNSHGRDDLCVIAPKAGPVSTFYNMFRTMAPKSWICTIFSVILAALAFKIIDFLHHLILINVGRTPKERLYSWGGTFVLAIQTFLGDSLTRSPAASALRCVAGGWVIYSLLITSAFTGKLASKLAIPLYKPDMETLSDLVDSNISLVIRKSLVKGLERFWPPDLFHEVNDSLIPIPIDKFDAYVEANLTSGKAFALQSHQADYMAYKSFNKETGRPSMQRMRECLIYFPRTYIAPRGSPYLGRVNELIGRLFDVGIVQYWEHLAEFEVLIKGIGLGKEFEVAEEEQREDEADGEEEDDEKQVVKVILTLDHMQSAFYIWTGGLMMGFCIFLMEIFWFKVVKRGDGRKVFPGRRVQFDEKVNMIDCQ